MNPNSNIDQLLDRYFAGTTTLEEENTLKAYFQTETVAPEHETWRPFFQFLEEEAEVEMSESFTDRLLEQLQAEETEAEASISMVNSRRRIIPMITRMAAIAAALVVAMTLVPRLWDSGMPADQTAEVDWEEIATQDEELAFEEAKAALLLLSSKLNGGTGKAADQLKRVKKAAQILK